MVKTQVARKIIKGGKKVKDFIDDTFPLGNFEDKPYSRPAKKVSDIITKTRRDGTTYKVKYTGGKKLGTLQPGISRRPSGPDSTAIIVEFSLKGKPYTKNFSEQKYDDAIGEARSFIKNKMKEIYGDDVKLLTKKEFLRLVKENKGLTRTQLAEKLNKLNYITNDQYVKIDKSGLLNNYFDNILKNQPAVKAFTKANPEAKTPKVITPENFKPEVLSTAMRQQLNKAFAKMFPEEKKLVDALYEQTELFNRGFPKQKGLAKPYQLDHVMGYERLKNALKIDTPELAAYLRVKHNLFGPKYKKNIDVFNAASKFYKTTDDRNKMLAKFASERMAVNPNTEKLLFDNLGLDGLQIVRGKFHGAQASAVHRKGTSKTAWFESINNKIVSNTRAADRDRKIKEGITNVLATQGKGKKAYKKAMLDAYKKTNDPIFDTVDDNFMTIYGTKLNQINRRQPIFIKEVEDAKLDAQRWLNKLPFEDRQAFIMERPKEATDYVTLTQVDARLPNPVIDPYSKGGRVGMDGGGKTIDPEDIKKEMDRALKEDGEILSEKEAIDNIVQLRLGFDEGGRVGMNIGGAQPQATGTLGGGGGTGTIGGGPTNKVGTIQSILAGIGAGIIDIPRGAFTLGAALMDLGLGTNKAAKVEQWFDDLTEFDETAEQSTLASLVRTLTNLGIPGAAAWKMGTQVTKKALLAKRNGNYFRITDPELEKRMKTALNAKGRIAATLGGAAGAGVSDAIFVGDPETVGTMGDMFGGGPTELTPNDSTEASREVMNRIKFGLDGALFLGVIGGTGSSIKSAIARRNDLSSTNSTLDKFLSKLRPRGAKPQEFFELERRNIGLRAGDVNYASEVARKLDKHIDAIFPFVKNPFDKMGNKGRAEFMDELNETLLSGKIEMDVTGKSAFGEMDPERVRKIIKMMRDRGAKQKDIDGVLDSFEQMRLGWAHMFSRLGYSMADADPKVLEEFKGIIGTKFKSYLGSTYEIFQNKSLIPLLNYAPTEEAVNKAVKLVQDSARTAGKTINDEEARHFVDKMVESARLPRGLATSKEKTSGIYLEVPDFFANKTVLSDLEFNPKIALDSLTPDARKVIDEVLGKVSDPMQTMLAGSGRLSLITRRNQFYEELMKKSADDIAEGKKGFFYDTELDAFNALGGNIKRIEIDPTRTIEAGITNPLNGKYAERGVAEAIEESAMLARDKGTVRQMYDSLILYPKATSQIAKTILSPITHVRNFVSAGAFAGANGLIPGLVSPDDMAAAMKDAYKALQIPGARMANDAYRDLLRLGVVNSNVRLGDLQRLLQDVNFGETLTAQKGLRGLMRPLSKAKKWTEEMYTAEDDFWKITSYALERQRLSRAYGKYGIKVNDELLNEEAASIVRNNIPNYDMVNDFIKGLRQLPFGNFVSFPAEIMRTSTNILGRALKEINYQHTLDDGRVVNPLRDIGYKRLFGFGTTVVAVPYGTVEAAKAIYDVTEDEMKAMRRFVPGWSQNSTLVPIRDTETGELKYVDFSHANAYDTMIRPINTMINSVGKGIDEGEIMKNVALGMFDATKETVSPFISESIWFEGASDIFLRGGRTREGRRLWTEATPWGEKVSLTIGHLVKTQMPGSIPALNRMGLAIREEVDEYGRTYEFGDELAGIFGFRAVKVDPIRSMKFKIADFRTGINAARREFTAPLLRGGVVDPADVVDRFEIANEAAYKVQQDMFKDYYGARTLGVNTGQLDLQFADRVSGAQLNAIKAGKFKPFIPSDNIKKAFADNARAIGAPNGYLAAERQIQSMIRQYNNLPLFGDLLFPKIENPFIGNTTLPNAAVQGIQPVAAVSGMQGGITAGGINNPNLTAIKGQQVFGSTDPIFGVG